MPPPGERRPLMIAATLTAVLLALLAAETLRAKLAVPPMPPQMECVLRRNCPCAWAIPRDPLIAPRLSQIRPLPPTALQR